MEQAYRYCRVLEQRPDSPEDWGRALELLEWVTTSAPTPAFEPLRRRLRGLLGRGAAAAAPGGRDRGSLAWRDAYLLGVVAECEPESPDRAGTNASSPPRRAADVAALQDARLLARRRAAGRALEQYRTMLTLRPHSFWGHYPAAVACFGLDQTAEAAVHLEHCLERRPENPILHGQLAGCLMRLRSYDQALERCNQALEGAPDLAEFYRTRAFIRARLLETHGLDADIRHFEVLSRILPRAFWGGTAILSRLAEGPAGRRDAIAIELGEVAPEELDARTMLATEIYDAGDRELAAAEFGKVLLVDPDHLAARFTRAIRAVKDHDFDQAQGDLEVALCHPDLRAYLRSDPLPRLHQLLELANIYLDCGRVEEAQTLARRALDLAIDLQVDRGRGVSHYMLARVHAVAGRTDPPAITAAAQQLSRAFLAHPDYRKGYQRDRTFDPVRARLDAAMPPAEAEARADLRRRKASAPMVQLAPSGRSLRAASMRLIPQEAQPE
jgi:tetratricopeptide (TPR) repeat protein